MQKNLARVYSAELEGIRARLVEVEVDLNIGLHAFNIVGLGDKAIGESKERINSALKNSGVKPPTRDNRKITVNLAPADIKKTGSQYDLAVAAGYLLATKQIKEFDSRDKIFLGELALDGRLRPINGALNIAEMAREKKIKYIFLPRQNANEAAAISGITVIPLESLEDAIDCLEERKNIKPAVFEPISSEEVLAPDFSEIRGQKNAKRALVIAAAGGHNMAMIGPPGVGKSMLAQALIGILPSLSTEEAIEITKIWSAAGLAPAGLISQRPFRQPHHTSSIISIVGGGPDPKPGEISLAHRGILFLDELPEFPKNILEALRQPMESGAVHVARAKRTLKFPAKFSLVAAMNPCPCGYHGDPEKECKCTPYEIIRYQKKVSGPLLDRIDLQIKVDRINVGELRRFASDIKKEKSDRQSPAIKNQIEAARKIQAERFGAHRATRSTSLRAGIATNSEMSSKQIEDLANLEPEAEKFLDTLGGSTGPTTSKSHLSPRGYYRLLKVARTIADLENKEKVSGDHIAEAFSYRLREEI